MRTAIDETENKRKRLIRNLELVEEPDTAFIGDINERRAELLVQKETLQRQLAELQDSIHRAPNPALLSRLPVTPVDLSLVPDGLSRRLFEALRLEIRYDGVANEAVCRITLTGDTIDAVSRATHETAAIPLQREAADHEHNKHYQTEEIEMKTHRDLATIFVVPSAGFEPATPALGEPCSIP